MHVRLYGVSFIVKEDKHDDEYVRSQPLSLIHI